MAKRGTLEHPKTKRLARAMQMPAYAALGLLEAVWHWVGRYAPTGLLTSEDFEDCADTIRYDQGGDHLAELLLATGWLDKVDVGWYIHDWHDHADDSTKKVLAKRGERFANGSEIRNQTQKPPSENDSRTDREQGATDSRQPKPKPKPKPKVEESGDSSLTCSVENDAVDDCPHVEAIPIDDDEPPNWFELFWDTYPPRAGDRKRAASEDKFKTRVKDGVDPRAIIAGAERYRAYCDATRKTKTELVQQATTWLNNRAWLEPFEIPEDAPSPPQRNGRRESPTEVYARLERDRLARIGGAA